MNLRLNKKTVLVTGGSSGIGKAIVTSYAEEPEVNIAFTYHSNRKGAGELARYLEHKNCSVLFKQMDLADHQNIDKVVQDIATTFGSVDVLINNAVFWGSPRVRGSRFEEIPIIEWKKMFDINVLGTVKTIQAVAPFMGKQKFGRIVSISSDIAYDSMRGSGPYGSVKSALFGLNANLVTEFSEDNILSNVVIPSLTFTDNAKNRFSDAFQEAASKAFPTNRPTRPEDVASLVAYLGSGANTHVNGEMVRVTGKGSQPMLNAIYRQTI